MSPTLGKNSWGWRNLSTKGRVTPLLMASPSVNTVRNKGNGFSLIGMESGRKGFCGPNKKTRTLLCTDILHYIK
jgi:hypothetical protein